GASQGGSPPHEHADVRKIVATAAARYAAYIHSSRHEVKSAVDIRCGLPAVHVHTGVHAADVIAHVLRHSEALKELDGDSRPLRHIRRELIEYGQCSLAAAYADGIGDLRARHGVPRGDGPDGPIADEIADIRDRPLRAGLDEQIVVELLEVLID